MPKLKGTMKEKQAFRFKAIRKVQAGERPGVVAEEMGVSRDSVVRWCSAVGVRPRKLHTRPSRQHVIDRLNAGESINRVAETTGIPPSTVRNMWATYRRENRSAGPIGAALDRFIMRPIQ